MSRETITALSLAFAFVDGCVFAMAQMFGAEVAYGGSPITPTQYGAAVYAIPALVWVAVQMNCALLAMAGALVVASKPRFLRLGALLMGVGNTGLAAMFMAFGVLAAGAPEGALVRYMGLCVGVPVCGAMAVSDPGYHCVYRHCGHWPPSCVSRRYLWRLRAAKPCADCGYSGRQYAGRSIPRTTRAKVRGCDGGRVSAARCSIR